MTLQKRLICEYLPVVFKVATVLTFWTSKMLKYIQASQFYSICCSKMLWLYWNEHFKYKGANCCLANTESALSYTEWCIHTHASMVVINNNPIFSFQLLQLVTQTVSEHWHGLKITVTKIETPTTPLGHPSPLSAVLSLKSAAIPVGGLYLCLF